MSISQACRTNLSNLVSSYRRATGASVETISRKFYGKRAFLREFLKGKHSISIDKFDAVIAAFHSGWPKGVTWPYLRPAVISTPKRKTVPKATAKRENHLEASSHAEIAR